MAARFWVGGTGTWDASDTTHWSLLSGSTGGAPVPTSADTVTFDGSSGGGTVTLNFGGTITIQSLTMGAFTGTWDNSVNNNNITVTASGSAFSLSGIGARTIKLGSATYTLSSGSNVGWACTTTTNLTLTATSSTIVFSGAGGSKTFSGGASQTYGTLSLSASSGTGRFTFINTAVSLATFTVVAPNYVIFNVSATLTISAALNLVGTSSAKIGLVTDTVGSAANIDIPSGQTAAWTSFRDVTFTSNTLIATSSFDLGHNTAVTITPPSQAHFSGGFFG